MNIYLKYFKRNIINVCAVTFNQFNAHLIIKGSLHPFALSFVTLETQSYFWMVMVYSFIFPWDGRNKNLSVLLPAYYDVKIAILRHNKQEVMFH